MRISGIKGYSLKYSITILQYFFAHGFYIGWPNLTLPAWISTAPDIIDQILELNAVKSIIPDLNFGTGPCYFHLNLKLSTMTDPW